MTRRSAPASAAAYLVALFAAVAAHAAPGDATRLSYARTPAAAACPDREALRAAVAKRLGYDPFFTAARQSIEVDLDANAERLTANMRFVNEQGIIVGTRQLQERPENCEELIASLSLAISITLDPSAALEGPRDAAPPRDGATEMAPGQSEASPEPSPEPAPPPAATKPQAKPRTAARTARRAPVTPRNWNGWLRASPVAALGRLPSLAWGGRVAAGLRTQPFQASIELAGFLPASKDSPRGGYVAASLISAAAVPCYAAERFALCAVVDLGIIDAHGRDVTEPKREREMYAAVGGRAELRQKLARRWAVVLGAELTKTLTPLELRLHDATVWQAPAWSGAAALGVEVAIF